MSLTQKLNELYSSLSNTRIFGFGGDDGSQKEQLTSLFGFSPIPLNGKIALYVRIGGPERAYFGVRPYDDFIGDYALKSKASFNRAYGDGQAHAAFGTKGATSRENIGYSNIMQPTDRNELQKALLNHRSPAISRHTKPALTIREVRRMYPFRIVGSGSGFTLEFAESQDEDYKPLSVSSASSLVLDILLDAVASAKDDAKKVVLAEALSQQGCQAILNSFLDKMNFDFKAFINFHMRHFLRHTESGLFTDSKFEMRDVLLRDFLSQGISAASSNVNQTRESFASTNIQPNVSRVSTAIEAPKSLDASQIYSNVSTQLGYIFSAAPTDANNLLQSQIDALNADKSSLQLKTQKQSKEIKSLKDKVPSENLKYLGIGAGAVSAFIAIQQESAQDLETWKKAAIVATGGLLGAVPILNFVTIATMPYLVDKGLELSRDEEFKSRVKTRAGELKDKAKGLLSQGETPQEA
jgi:hypothetical protein